MNDEDGPKYLTMLEKQIWAEVYSALFIKAAEDSVKLGRDITELSGFSIAELADLAVEKKREALSCDDAQYLLDPEL